jgi:hypothetical protein
MSTDGSKEDLADRQCFSTRTPQRVPPRGVCAREEHRVLALCIHHKNATHAILIDGIHVRLYMCADIKGIEQLPVGPKHAPAPPESARLR